MQLKRRGVKVGAMVLGAVIVAVGVFGVAGPAAAVLPDVCYGSGTSNMLSCTGKDPQEMGCSPGAVSQAYTGMPTGTVDLRYSAACHARWARFTWGGAGAAYPATLWIETSSGSKYTKAVAGYQGEQVWTKMFSGNLTTRACVKFWHNAFGVWVTNCTVYKP